MKTSDLLIPVRKTRSLPGRFKWPESVVLCSPFEQDQLPLAQLARTLKTECGSRVRQTRNHLNAHTLLVRRNGGFDNLEGYRITIEPDCIEILAPTAAAAYYAVQTLRELVQLHGKSLPCCQIDDSPDFWRRGVYLDCSRGKVPTVETLKLLVEYLASMKLNELQLYVENVFTFKSHPAIGKGFSSFTPEELLAVQDHCNLHHIRFVPSLTSFGHFEKILRLPEYSHLAEMPGGGNTICPIDAGSIKLIADMYGDFLPLFEAHDFNVCGDEPWELGKGRSKPKAERVGAGKVYLDFIKQINKLCLKHGKRMNLWSDIVLNHPEVIPEIPTDIVMLNWDYSPKGGRIPRTHEFVDAGLDVVVCPGTSGWQSHGTRMQNAIDNVRVFAQVGRKNNAEGLLNTDWGDGGHRNPLGASFHGYAHGAAHAWNGKRVDDATFTQTFCHHVLKTGNGKVVRLVQDLGDVETLTGTRPYHTIGQTFDANWRYKKTRSAVSPVGVRKRGTENGELAGLRRALSNLRNATTITKGALERDPFARLVLEDLDLAAELDRVGCTKSMLFKVYDAGKQLEPGACRELERAMGTAAAHLERNWLKRNKPSRLKDNLQLFSESQRELIRLAKKG